MVEVLFGMQIVSLSSTHLAVVPCSVPGKVCASALNDCKKDEFMDLEQGDMRIDAYEVKFHSLSIYAT